MVKDIKWDEKVRLYKHRMYLTGLYNPDDISVEYKDLAYIAGLFNGEVALGIHHTGRSYSLSMTYMKTNYDILKYISNVFGGKVRQVKPQPCYKSKVWQWSIGAGNAYRVLMKIYPFLRIKQEAAAICIEFFERFWQGRSGKPRLVSDSRRAIGAHYMAQLQGYQSKPGSGKKSPLSHMEIKQRRIISTPPRYTKEIAKPKNYFLPYVSVPAKFGLYCWVTRRQILIHHI